MNRATEQKLRQRYQHYKGNFYILFIDNATLEADGTTVCIYECEKSKKVYVRPRAEFFEVVENPNGAAPVPRFKLVEP